MIVLRRVFVLLLIIMALITGSTYVRPIDVTANLNVLHYQATETWWSGDWQLQQYAQAHADRLAEEDALYHSSLIEAPGDYVLYGENVGMGPSVGAIIQGFLDSPTHLENITDPFTHVGVGVAERDGKVWIVMVVAR